MTKIYVNGQLKEVPNRHLNYYDIVDLAFGRPMMRLQTITYSCVVEQKTFGGELTFTDPAIEVVEGMSITCGYTGNA